MKIWFDNLVWTHLTSGLCCSSGKDMNSSMEREPDPSRSWAQNGKLQNFTHHRGSCLSIVLDLSFLKRVTISGIILVLWLHVSRVGRPKHVMQKEETSKIWFFCLPKRSGKINETSWLSLFFCWTARKGQPVFWSAFRGGGSRPRQTRCSSLAGSTRFPSCVSECKQFRISNANILILGVKDIKKNLSKRSYYIPTPICYQ